MKKKSTDGFHDIYMDIAEHFGEDIAIKIFERYRGQQVVFPMKLHKSEYIYQKIKAEYNGSNIKELARKYNYTERWIRKMFNKDN